ncbi:MAG: hypothetical protein KatS3mg111_1026 [Pirellulaceae bacterium]|nr:MAG: hypothetical protein KatS3mg111_1026 [Pirellulaceae bacterium]
MNIDDDLCLCFHVSWRKVLNYIRVHKVRVPSRLAECHGAGTGCGWCRRAMVRLVEAVERAEPNVEELQAWLDLNYSQSSVYAEQRRDYLAARRPPVEGSRDDSLDCGSGDSATDR